MPLYTCISDDRTNHARRQAIALELILSAVTSIHKLIDDPGELRTSALRRITHLLVSFGGKSAIVNGLPSGPITAVPFMDMLLGVMSFPGTSSELLEEIALKA